jgi:hypothetical protein
MIVGAHILLLGSSGGREMPTPSPSDNVSLRFVTARASWLGVSCSGDDSDGEDSFPLPLLCSLHPHFGGHQSLLLVLVVVALLALGWSDPRDLWLDLLGPWSDLSIPQSNSAFPRWWWLHLRGCAACASGHACPLWLGVETAMGTLLG